jgi:hypothetical protein
MDGWIVVESSTHTMHTIIISNQKKNIHVFKKSHPMRRCPIINHPPAQSRISPPPMCLGHALPAHTYATALSCPCVVEGCQSRGRECECVCSIKDVYVRLDYLPTW